MRLAFCILKFFPYGGLQRDFLRIAESCVRRGHEVDVYTRSWEGDVPAALRVTTLPARGLSNHSRHWSFYQGVKARLAGASYDAVIGFNKMPGLDVYFSGDVCFKARALKRSPLYRLTARYRRFALMEEAVFSPDAVTQILLLVESDREVYMKQYGTPADRFHILPPDVPEDRHAPPDRERARIKARMELGITENQTLILALGSGFKVKGLDRSLEAIAALPAEIRKKTKFMVIGQDNPRPFQRLSKRLGLDGQISFLGGRDDAPRFLMAADLLLHPAYFEAAGTVLLEAMAAGVPVLTTDTCGFAPHIQRANAGLVLTSPFSQVALNRSLSAMLSAAEPWGDRGLAYIRSIDVGSRADYAADILERTAHNRGRTR